jgi:hypothetical protein
MYEKYVVGKKLFFPLSASFITNIITAVDHKARTVTYCIEGDPEDEGTETMDDLDAVDVYTR